MSKKLAVEEIQQRLTTLHNGSVTLDTSSYSGMLKKARCVLIGPMLICQVRRSGSKSRVISGVIRDLNGTGFTKSIQTANYGMRLSLRL
jgi:hypothetical protein